VSITTVGIVKVGLVPTAISNLGINLSPANQAGLLKVLTVIVAYFLVAFVIYAVSDWLSGRWALHLSLQEDLLRSLEEIRAGAADSATKPELVAFLDKSRGELAEFMEKQSARIKAATTPILAVRHSFETAIPLGAGVYALGTLIEAAW
jgi:hypothetical protein